MIKEAETVNSFNDELFSLPLDDNVSLSPVEV